MPASVPLRRGNDARHLRKLASRCKDARQSRRLLSLAARLRIVPHGSRSTLALTVGGVERPARIGPWIANL